MRKIILDIRKIYFTFKNVSVKIIIGNNNQMRFKDEIINVFNRERNIIKCYKNKAMCLQINANMWLYIFCYYFSNVYN